VRRPAHAYDFNANEPLRLPLRALYEVVNTFHFCLQQGYYVVYGAYINALALSATHDAEPAACHVGFLVVCFLERRAGVIYGGYFSNNGLIKAAFFITSRAG
jgi:hypothetical protein